MFAFLLPAERDPRVCVDSIKVNSDGRNRIKVKNQLFHAINSQLVFFLCLWGNL